MTVNSLDTDSDGDGCSDALESSITTFTSADIDATTLQLKSSVDSNGVPSTVNGGQTGVDWTDATTQSAACSAVPPVDTDGDGLSDNVDQDDDNDGILDVHEYSFPASNTRSIDIIDGESVDTILSPGQGYLVFDIYRVDNSFNLFINGIDIGGEIELNLLLVLSKIIM
jgi:hypothetical protein